MSTDDLFDTRREAQRLAVQFSSHQRGRILRELHRVGSGGLTAEELEFRLAMSGNSVRPRLAELEGEGSIGRDGRTRRTLSGRLALLYFVADFLDRKSPGAGEV